MYSALLVRYCTVEISTIVIISGFSLLLLQFLIYVRQSNKRTEGILIKEVSIF